MIQIPLGKKKDVDPSGDPLRRLQIGWSDGLFDQPLHDIASSFWVMPDHASNESGSRPSTAAGASARP